MKHEALAGWPSYVVAAGLIVEAFALTVNSPLFFSLFIAGGGIVVLGSAGFLLRLLRSRTSA